MLFGWGLQSDSILEMLMSEKELFISNMFIICGKFSELVFDLFKNMSSYSLSTDNSSSKNPWKFMDWSNGEVDKSVVISFT